MDHDTYSKSLKMSLLKGETSWFLLGFASLFLVLAFGTARPAQGEEKTETAELYIVPTASRQNAQQPTTIEWLRIKVHPSQRQQFVQKDAEIWTSALQRYPGFIDKDVWLNPNNAAEVIIVVRWISRERWFSVPKADLESLQQKFDQAFPFEYSIQEVREYQAL